ncbi:MAG: hypothetical protein FJ280_25785, partial [Planctomycetes bacterium]|nr:hypothetical protein [Planctomycetota bacterium]
MANEQGQSDRDRERPQVTPSGSEEDLFGVPFVPAPGPEDIFAALGASASSMARPDVFPFGRGAGAEPPSRLPLGALTQNLLAFRGFGPLSRVQKLLVGGIVAIAIALLWVLAVKPPAAEHVTRDPSLVEDVARLSAPVGGAVTREGPPARDTAFGEEPPSRTSAPGAPAPVPSPVGREGRTLPGPEPLSLQLADKLYLRRDFEPARTMYEKLHRRLPATEDNQALRDFLLLRMALCLKNSGPAAEAGGTSASLPEGMGDADGLLRAVSLSRWPILRALARYHQSVILLDRRRYLEAATRAYQTLALIEVANYDKKWVAAVQQQCGFLAAEAMTRHVLSLCDADVNLPAALWSGHPDLDPFVEIDEPQLRAFLAAGAEGLEGTVLGPQIRRSGDQPGAPRWSVLCNGAPLEELLARFAANAGVSLHWTDTAPAATDDNLRARP